MRMDPRCRVFPAAVSSLCFLLALVPAVPGTAGGTESGATQSAGAQNQDLSGVWEIKLDGKLAGPSLLCQAVPPLNLSWRDTVLAARNLEELIEAIVPDSERAWFDRACKPRYAGNTVVASCRFPLVYAKPCVLNADIIFHGALRDSNHVSGQGGGDVAVTGPGFCPETTCPGEIHLAATRVGPVPRPAAAGGDRQ